VAVAVVVDAAAVAVAAMAAVVAAVMVVAAADAGHRSSGSTKSGTRHSGPAFLLRDSVSQRERSRGWRMRRKKIPRSIEPRPIMASAGRYVAVFGAIIPSASA
jgi:hypothetical protein